MERMGLRLLTAVFMGASLMLLQVALAEAHTCSSVCNQIRRACLDVGKAAREVERAVCEDEGDGCKANCAADGEICPTECEDANTACVAQCMGNPECGAGCSGDLSQCLDGCANCVANCSTAREVCTGEAEQNRQQAKLGCDEARGECSATCLGPIDSQCVSACKAEARASKKGAKDVERECKRACPGGTDRQACVRGCRMQCNMDLQGCANQEMLYLAQCAGIAP